MRSFSFRRYKEFEGFLARARTFKMQFLGFITLISLAVVIYGEIKIEEDNGIAQDYVFQCGNIYCRDGFYCTNDYKCKPKRPCTHHAHCPKDQYCDMYRHGCRKGVRRCYAQSHCSRGNMCKDGICQKRECMKHSDCPGNQACRYPPGLCKDYEAYCYADYYCKVGYVCVGRTCKKRECNSNHECKLGDECKHGFCKPIAGFCMNDGDCDNGECCAKAGDSGGVCKRMRKPGQWCPLQQSIQECPCESGSSCEQKTSSMFWGKCVETGGGSGSGSGDF